MATSSRSSVCGGGDESGGRGGTNKNQREIDFIVQSSATPHYPYRSESRRGTSEQRNTNIKNFDGVMGIQNGVCLSKLFEDVQRN